MKRGQSGKEEDCKQWTKAAADTGHTTDRGLCLLYHLINRHPLPPLKFLSALTSIVAVLSPADSVSIPVTSTYACRSCKGSARHSFRSLEQASGGVPEVRLDGSGARNPAGHHHHTCPQREQEGPKIPTTTTIHLRPQGWFLVLRALAYVCACVPVGLFDQDGNGRSIAS